MSVKRCHLCDEDPLFRRRHGQSGLADGADCPICYRPTCRYHLTTVRWRWRSSGHVDAAQVCQECKRTYQHRNWDAVNRDWIT
ncbi:MAG: hypothetical protein ACE5E7_08335 [Anaerolineae bacterium]